MQCAQFFRNAAQSFVNRVEASFPNTVGEIQYAPEVVMVAFLLFVVYFFMGILWQFLFVFCACLLALVVYNNYGRIFGFVGGRPYRPVSLIAVDSIEELV